MVLIFLRNYQEYLPLHAIDVVLHSSNASAKQKGIT